MCFTIKLLWTSKSRGLCRSRQEVRFDVLWFFFSASSPPSSIVKRVAGLGCHDPGLILTAEQQSQAGRLSAVYFVSVYPLRPECKHTHTHACGFIHSLAHSITTHPCLKWMDDILPFTIHICFSLSAVWRLISVLLCFVWYGAAPMHFYSLSYIAFLFKAMCSFAWLYVTKKSLCCGFCIWTVRLWVHVAHGPVCVLRLQRVVLESKSSH